jgi:hypothetical protein
MQIPNFAFSQLSRRSKIIVAIIALPLLGILFFTIPPKVFAQVFGWLLFPQPKRKKKV